MKNFIMLPALFFTLFSQAQQKNYFIYFQSDAGEPFTVKFKNKLYPSNAGGYLILPRLPAGENRISISFQKEPVKETPFLCRIGNLDIGYKIISVNSEPQLLDINEGSILKADLAATTENIEIKKPADTLVRVPVTYNEPLQKAPENNGYKQPYVLIKQPGETGTDMVYIDNGIAGNDTIRVFIPVLKEALPVVTDTVTKIPANKTEAPKPELKKEDQFLEFTVGKKNSSDSLGNHVAENNNSDSVKKNNAPVPLVLVNTDCKKIATNEDYLALRKKIAGEYLETEMLKVAQKVLRQRCYLTAQIKNISVLFFTDENKFNFFRLAYPFIYDSEQFPGLIQELKDAGFIEKFNALIKR